MFGATTYRISIVVDGKDNASHALGGLSGALSRMGDIAGGIIGADIFRRIAGGILDVAGAAVSATATYQRMQIGLEGLMARELAHADETKTIAQVYPMAQEKAKAYMDELSKFAILSPYQIEQTQNTYRTAMAFGFASDEAMKFTKATLTMAAGVGADSDMLQRMGYNLAQVRLQGKVTAMDVRQLALAGFDLNSVLQYTGKQYGVVIKDHLDFNKAIKEGKITWQQFTESYAKYAETNFSGASERMARTLFGLSSTFKDLFMLTMPKVLGPAAEVVTVYLNKILDAFIAFREGGQLEIMGENLRVFAEGVMAFIGQVAEFFAEVGRYWAIISTLDLSSWVAWNEGSLLVLRNLLYNLLPREVVDFIIQQVGYLVLAFANIRAFWDENGPAIMDLVGQVFTTVAGFISDVAERVIPWLVQTFYQITYWINENGPLITEFGNTMLTVFQWIMDKVVEAWTFIQPLLQGLIDLILNLAKIIMQVATGDWAGAWDTIQKTVEGVISSVRKTIEGFLSWLNGAIGEAIKALTELGQKGSTSLLGAPTPGAKSHQQIMEENKAKNNKKASGGAVFSGLDYMVGETGIEIFRPWTNGVIIPANQTAQIVNGGGNNVTIPIYATVNNGMDVESLAYRVAEVMRNAS